ncbi:hypothetical protein [Dactylosporangium sp. NPDC051541]|uniref:hypothetical protein n=1 Tax=Dactylosporangium sp. NPDC051541 TaxID=3363977 RepID=UPI00378A3305
MKHRTGQLAVTLAAVTAAALLAAPAQAAAPTFTISPGGTWSGTRAAGSTVGIRDAVSNQVTLCSGLTVSGSFTAGAGQSGTNAGSLTGISFTGCKAAGVDVTVTVHTSAANPAPINLSQVFPVGSDVVVGQATNISLTLDDANGCHAEVGARTTSGGGPGFTGLAYRSGDARLSFAAGGKGLFVQSATERCASAYHGLAVKQFDRISLGGFGDSIEDSSVTLTPAQTITSP